MQLHRIIRIRRYRQYFAVVGFISLLAWPMLSTAQEIDESKRVGVLISGKEDHKNVKERLTIFKNAMQTLGWHDGKNVYYDVRWGNANKERTSVEASKLVDMKPAVVFTIGTPATGAMHKQTKAIPIVFAIVSDPVGGGFVESLSRPGGNVTGFITYYPEFVEKWIELLKEVAPQTRRTGLIFNPHTAPFSSNKYLQPFLERAAERLAIVPLMLPVTSEMEIESAIKAIAEEPGASLIVMPDSFMFAHGDTIIELTEKQKVPTIYPFGPFAYRGGLIAYGVNMSELTRRAATYVDHVLRGQNVVNLPVQAPTKFEMIVNVKAANAIGLNIPTSVLIQATDVIE
ncbi:MAG: putative ABC transport system substrate-binding protein [Kiritimatiellia bacterium]|jgi:putative ABC transport system substrate-binding protein